MLKIGNFKKVFKKFYIVYREKAGYSSYNVHFEHFKVVTRWLQRGYKVVTLVTNFLLYLNKKLWQHQKVTLFTS